MKILFWIILTAMFILASHYTGVYKGILNQHMQASDALYNIGRVLEGR